MPTSVLEERHDGMCSARAGPISEWELPLSPSLLREPERDRYGLPPRATIQHKLAAFNLLNVQTSTGGERKQSFELTCL